MDERKKAAKKVFLITKSRLLNKLSGFGGVINSASNFWETKIVDIEKTMCHCNNTANEMIIDDDFKDTASNIFIDNDEKPKMEIREENLFVNKFDDLGNFSDKKKENLEISLMNRIWTPDEDQILLDYVKDNKCRNWKKISKIIKSKTSQQCAYRYNKLLFKQKPWDRKEEIRLVEFVEKYGESWEFIVPNFENRSQEELKSRFYSKLLPKLQKSKFSPEEDKKLLELHNRYGEKWDEIKKQFENKGLNDLKTRFFSLKYKLESGQEKNASGKDSISKFESLSELSGQSFTSQFERKIEINSFGEAEFAKDSKKKLNSSNKAVNSQSKVEIIQNPNEESFSFPMSDNNFSFNDFMNNNSQEFENETFKNELKFIKFEVDFQLKNEKSIVQNTMFDNFIDAADLNFGSQIMKTNEDTSQRTNLSISYQKTVINNLIYAQKSDEFTRSFQQIDQEFLNLNSFFESKVKEFNEILKNSYITDVIKQKFYDLSTKIIDQKKLIYEEIESTYNLRTKLENNYDSLKSVAIKYVDLFGRIIKVTKVKIKLTQALINS